MTYLRTSDGRRELRALQQALEEPIVAGARARVILSSALEWLLQA